MFQKQNIKPSVSQFWALQSCLTERLPGYTQVDPPTSDGNHSSTVSLPLRSYKRSSVNTVVMTNSGCLNEGRSLAIIFPPSAACCALLSGAVWSFRSCIFIFSHSFTELLNTVWEPRQEKLRCQITLTWLLQWTSWEKLGKEQASF